jgi:hypothetical protein
VNVLLIPEDFRNDQYILKPLFERLFTGLGRARAKISVCQDPLLQGVTEALKEDRIAKIVDRYRMVDIFVLCVDRDGVATRRQKLDDLEAKFSGSRHFLAVNAWEELETWLLAGLDDLLLPEWSWSEIRADTSVKERYFEPLARRQKVADGPGGGRKALGERAARRLPAIRQKCAEDFHAVALRLESLVATERRRR